MLMRFLAICSAALPQQSSAATRLMGIGIETADMLVRDDHWVRHLVHTRDAQKKEEFCLAFVLDIEVQHNVPLSEAACAILLAIKGNTTPRPSALVFTNRVGLRVCKTDLLKLARRLQPDMPKITVHGFRSCARDWVGDETNHAREVAEHALAHKVPHKVKGVEGDYRRGTALKKRRIMLEDWAKFCAAAPAESAIDQVA